MKRIATIAVGLVLAVTAANAADKINLPAEMLGVWCQARVDGSWTFYERGKCNNAVNSIALSSNGDYVRHAPLAERVSIEERCKAVQKPNRWINYNCVIGNGAFGHTEKRIHKWMLDDGYAGELALNTGKWE